MVTSAPADLGGTYYPSCVVNLMIRYDENFSIDSRLNEAAAGQSDASSPNAATVTTGTPLFLSNQGNVPGSSLVGRIPKSASVELPGLRRPGTFNLTFDYRDLPLDPRLVRSVGVEIYMGTVSANDFANGIVAPVSSDRSSQITASRRLSAVNQSPDTLVLKGIVDNWHVTHGASGSVATLEGRDLVGLFLNTPLTPEIINGLNLGQPIDAVVRQLVNKISDWSKNLDVVAALPAQWPDGKVPFLAPLEELDPNTPLVRQKADSKKPRKSVGADQDKLNFWDLITRYCNFVGAVPYYTVAPNAARTPDAGYKATLMIVPQWGLYNYLPSATKKAPSPFHNSRAPDQKVRRLMYGRNIEELTLERKFQGITARAVELVCYNPSSDSTGPARLLTAISNSKKPTYAERQGVSSPLSKDAAAAGRSGVSPNGEASKDDVLRIVVNGIGSQAQLQTLADGLYEEIMRGETGGSVTTKALSSFGGNNEDPDLLYIRPRDPLTLAVDIRPMAERAPNVDTPYTEANRKPPAQLATEIEARGLDANLARAVAYSSRNAVAELQSTFRVNAVKFDWDINSGISVGLDFHNYIVARNSIQATPPTEGAPARKAAKAAGGNKRRRQSTYRRARQRRRR